MATRAANIQTALDQVAVLLVELTVDPKPDYSVDGKSYSWASYFSMLVDKQESLQKALANASGPYEISTRGYV